MKNSKIIFLLCKDLKSSEIFKGHENIQKTLQLHVRGFIIVIYTVLNSQASLINIIYSLL